MAPCLCVGSGESLGRKESKSFLGGYEGILERERAKSVRTKIEVMECANWFVCL